MSASIPFIDLKAQYHALKPEIDAQIEKVLTHGAFIGGPEIKELESALCKYLGCQHALAVSSGTDAALIAMMALGIGPGDEVICPTFSFIATAETIVLTGAKPVYVDIEADTYNIDVTKIEEKITDKTKAIVPVSLYGQIADMDEINALAQKHGLFVIEDAAQSFGATYKGQRSGTLCDITVTSFFPAKPLGCYGDGGAIFTNNTDLAQKMDQIRSHGQESRYYHTRIGINGRLDTLQCAILLPKLARYEWEIEQRQKVADRFNGAFAELAAKGIHTPVVRTDRNSVWAQYTLRASDRDGFQQRLQKAGVPTSIHYPRIMPDQPAYQQDPAKPGDWDVSRKAALEVISLPMYPDMPTEIQDQIIQRVIESA